MSIKVLAITQARTGSSRLPGKVLKTIGGKSLLQIHLDRISRSVLIDEVIVATTAEEADSAIADLAALLGYQYFRGSEDDVLDRYYHAAKPHDPEYVVRITSDCPLIDPALVDDVVRAVVDAGVDYGSNFFERTYPDGTDAEVFTFGALERAWREASTRPEREHVTPYIIEHCDQRGHDLFRAVSVHGDEDYSRFRLTIDYPEDFELLKTLSDRVGFDRGWKSYADYLTQNPDVYAINKHFGSAASARNRQGSMRKR